MTEAVYVKKTPTETGSSGGSILTDEPRLGDEVSDGDRNLLHDVLTNNLDVVLELRRDGNDGSALSNGSCRRNRTNVSRRNSLNVSKRTICRRNVSKINVSKRNSRTVSRRNSSRKNIS